MKSIVFITRNLNGGGSQRVIVNLANAMCRDNRVSILVLTGENCAYMLDPSVAVYRCPEAAALKGIRKRFRKNLPTLYKILWCRKMKKLADADVAISSLPHANLMNVYSRGREKVIVREGSDPMVVGKRHFADERKAMRLADHVVFLQCTPCQGQL